MHLGGIDLRNGKHKYVAEIETVAGVCVYCHKTGDKFYFDGYATPGGLCGGAYWVLYPVIMAMENGVKFKDEEKSDCMKNLPCPHNGNIKLKLTKLS